MKSVLSLKVAVPLVLGILVSIAIGIYAELGFRRLDSANREMAAALEMQALLSEAMSLVVDAETGQRGYLLTGKDEYLKPYQSAVPRVEQSLSRLRELLVASGTGEQRASAGRIYGLIGKKLSELEITLALFQKDGTEAAQALMSTGIGRRTMEELRSEVDNLAGTQRRQADAAADRWARDIEFARAGMQGMTVATVSLLLVVLLLARNDALKREEHRRREEVAKRELEATVEARTAELSELSNHLQVVREEEKSRLARDIHDELGGILVSAKMDVAWSEKRIRRNDAEAAAKLGRALQALDEGVQIKRRIIEELRPTLLDNMGLSAAMDWQVREVCSRAGLKCEIVHPEDDSMVPPPIAIALYRILQEALTNIVKYAHARRVDVDLELHSDRLRLRIDDDGVGIADGAQTNRLSHGISGMRQRVRALHGEFSIRRGRDGGTIIEVTIPLPPPAEQPAAIEAAPSAAAAH